MRANRGDMTSRGRPRQDARKSIRDEIKQKRGSQIPLSQTPTIRKEVDNPAINRDRSVASRHQLHNPMNIGPIKTLGQQDLAQKSLAYRIVSLLKIKLKNHALVPRTRRSWTISCKHKIPSKMNLPLTKAD